MIDVEGSSNRVAGRDFHDSSINDSVVIITSAAAPAQELTSLQRKRLNTLVADMEAAYGVAPAQVWRQAVHMPFGVKALRDVPHDRFADVERSLLTYQEQLHDLRHAKNLADKARQLARNYKAEERLAAWCQREFGYDDLARLTPEQLKLALQEVERFKPVYIAVEPEQKPAKPDTWWRGVALVVCGWPTQTLALMLLSGLFTKLFL